MLVSENMDLYVGLTSAFLAVTTFVYVGLSLFTRGWESYEEHYVEGAQSTLDAMWITMPVQNVVYLSILSFAVTGLLAFAVSQNWVIALTIGTLGFMVPKFALMYLKHRRLTQFGDQLVDALVNMGNSLRAGFSLPQALDLVQREMDNPMSQEMRLVVQEMRLGVAMEDALGHLAVRMPSQDMDLLVTAIAISREIGGNLTEVFENIADTIRERHRIEGKIASLTAQGKLQGIVIAMLPIGIAFAINVLTPGFLEPLYTTLPGALMIAAVVVLEVLGLYFIYKITAIEV